MRWPRLKLFRRRRGFLGGRDWPGVFIDVAVVMLGILIAFQVERSYEAWRNTRAERLYLERLQGDALSNLHNTTRLVGVHRDLVNELRVVHRALAGDAAARRQAAAPGFGCAMLQMPDLRLADTAYQELAAANKLDLLRDRELRALLRAELTQHRFVRGQMEYFRTSFVRYAGVIDPHLDYWIGDGGGFACRVDLAGLAADPKARPLIARIYRDQSVFMRFRLEEMRAVRATHARLRQLLKAR